MFCTHEDVMNWVCELINLQLSLHKGASFKLEMKLENYKTNNTSPSLKIKPFMQ